MYGQQTQRQKNIQETHKNGRIERECIQVEVSCTFSSVSQCVEVLCSPLLYILHAQELVVIEII